jgi:hypothetical protein
VGQLDLSNEKKESENLSKKKNAIALELHSSHLKQ